MQTLKQGGLVTSLAASADGGYLASAAVDVYVWDLHKGAIVKTLKGHTNLVTAVAFSPDNKLLASGGWDKTARIWNLQTGQTTHVLQASGDVAYMGRFGPRHHTLKLPVDSVAFSPDSKLLATGGADHFTRLWEVVAGTLAQTFAGPTMPVSAVAFSPDGKRLASSSLDRTIWLWTLQNNR